MDSINIITTLFTSLFSIFLYEKYNEYQKQQRLNQLMNGFYSFYTIFVSVFGSAYIIEKISNSEKNFTARINQANETLQVISTNFNILSEHMTRINTEERNNQSDNDDT
jgi:hypothetical protein